MIEPLLEAKPMTDDDLDVHRYPPLLLVWYSVLAALLTLLYITHWDPFDLGILDFHTSSLSIILDQVILTLGCFGIPWALFLNYYSADGLIIEESVRADIKDANVFLTFLAAIFFIATLVVILIDLAFKHPFQSILIAYLFIFLSLFFWHGLRKIILRNRAVDTTIADLLVIAAQMEKKPDASAGPTGGV